MESNSKLEALRMENSSYELTTSNNSLNSLHSKTLNSQDFTLLNFVKSERRTSLDCNYCGLLRGGKLKQSFCRRCSALLEWDEASYSKRAGKPAAVLTCQYCRSEKKILGVK